MHSVALYVSFSNDYIMYLFNLFETLHLMTRYEDGGGVGMVDYGNSSILCRWLSK